MSSKKISIFTALAFAIGFSAVLFALHLANRGSHAQSSAAGYGLSVHIAGNQLVNAQGNRIRLIGVDRMTDCKNAAGFDGPTDSAAVQALKVWNINAVRLTMNEDCWLGINNPPIASATYQNAVIQYVNLLNKAGIYVIIDLHVNAPAGIFSQAQQSMADEDHALAYWTSMADAFKNDPAVIFEPYNEPHITTSNTSTTDPWACWLHGCQATQYLTVRGGNVQSLDWQTAGMQQLVTTIRNTGATNVITLGGLGWSNNLSQILQHLPNDSQHQLAATFHNYYGWGCGPGSSTKPDCWDTVITSVAAKIPVITTEFGEENQCKTDYPIQYMDWADQQWTKNHLSISYAAWVWTPGTCGTGLKNGFSGAWGLLSNWNGTASSYGQPILSHIQQLTKASAPSPAISLTTPPPAATVSGPAVSIAAHASVSSGTITSLTLKAAGTTLKTCSNVASCTTTWNTTHLPNASTTLSASTTASDGKTATTSETVTVHNTTPPPTISAPTTLTSPAQTTTSISLAWHASQDSTYPASQLTYHVYRNGTAVGTTTAGTTSYTNTKLLPGTYYSYRLTASDPTGTTSGLSAALAVTTKPPDCPAPAAPKGLSAHATSPTTAAVSWQAVSPSSATCTIAHYVVERGGVALAQPTAPGYTDRSLTPKTTYTYAVLAVVTGGISGQTATVTVTTPAATQPDPGPSAPSHLVATPVSPTQVNLTWAPSLDRVTGIKQYEIRRNGTPVSTTTTASFGDSGLHPHTSYTYQVIAVSGGNRTASSAAVQVTTLRSNQGGGTSGNSGSTSSSASSIPLLQHTTSVGSGSDTGSSTSQNPTAPGSGTVQSLTTAGATPPRGGSFRRVAAIAGGSLAVVLLLAGGLALRVVWWRRRGGSATNDDPDLYAATVVRPEPDHPTDGNHTNQDKEHQP